MEKEKKIEIHCEIFNKYYVFDAKRIKEIANI